MSVGILNLCPAAKFHLIISSIAIVVMSLTVFGTNMPHCFRSNTCNSPFSQYMFVVYSVKILYIVFWTWLLNIICRKVSPSIAWLIALFPFILFFIFLSINTFFVLKSGFTNKTEGMNVISDEVIYDKTSVLNEASNYDEEEEDETPVAGNEIIGLNSGILKGLITTSPPLTEQPVPITTQPLTEKEKQTILLTKIQEQNDLLLEYQKKRLNERLNETIPPATS